MHTNQIRSQLHFFPFSHLISFNFIFIFIIIFALSFCSLHFKISLSYLVRNRVCFFCLVRFILFSPEFSYRPGLSVLSEDTNNAVASHGAGGPPNRPLPPTPDDDDQQGDRTLIMKRVSFFYRIPAIKKATFFRCNCCNVLCRRDQIFILFGVIKFKRLVFDKWTNFVDGIRCIHWIMYLLVLSLLLM